MVIGLLRQIQLWKRSQQFIQISFLLIKISESTNGECEVNLDATQGFVLWCDTFSVLVHMLKKPNPFVSVKKKLSHFLSQTRNLDVGLHSCQRAFRRSILYNLIKMRKASVRNSHQTRGQVNCIVAAKVSPRWLQWGYKEVPSCFYSIYRVQHNAAEPRVRLCKSSSVMGVWLHADTF